MTTHADLITSYFQHADARDLDAYLELFAPGAVVEDDGHRYVGLDAVRGWRGSTVPVRSDVLAVADGDRPAAHVRVSGEFPGSSVTLAFRFRFDDNGRITSLTIAP